MQPRRLSIIVFRMRLIIQVLIALVALRVPVDAQERAFQCDPRKKISLKEGEALIDKVQARYQDEKSIRAKFYQYSFLAALETSELSSGDVLFLKPGQMRWNYKEPEIQIFLVKDGTVWFYQAAERQVMVNEFEKVILSDLPVAFLMGLGNLRRDFTFKGGCRNNDGIVLDLRSLPKPEKSRESGEQSELAGFKLLIDPQTNFPRGAEVAHIGGNLTSILLAEVELGAKLDASMFEPVFPKGTDTNDLRTRPVEVR
ncbi:MAG: outer membrane lipoprotein carrier protein LolA [Deltaproteobacteria bacterium]|nr:outer membrane lipoprotein carrier protein LolA [Deltaproteobacteria bacterium]